MAETDRTHIPLYALLLVLVPSRVTKIIAHPNEVVTLRFH